MNFTQVCIVQSKNCGTPHIGIPYSPLSFDICYFGFVLFDKDPSSVHGAWVHGEDFGNYLMNEQLSKLSI